MEVLRRGLATELLRQQPQQRDDIGLFDHLGLPRPLPPKHHVHWHGTACVGGEINLFEREKARELLEQSGFRIEAGRHRFRDLPPLLEFGVVERRVGLRGSSIALANAHATMPPHQARAGCSSAP